jgi:hypothetical protein
MTIEHAVPADETMEEVAAVQPAPIDEKKNAEFLELIKQNDPLLHTLLSELSTEVNLLDVTATSAHIAALMVSYVGVFTSDPFAFGQMMIDVNRNLLTTTNRMMKKFAQGSFQAALQNGIFQALQMREAANGPSEDATIVETAQDKPMDAIVP